MIKRLMTIPALSAAFMVPAMMPAMAQDGGIDAKVNAIFGAATGWFVALIFSPLPGTENVPWIVLWLVIAAIVFTLYFGFVQFRLFGHALRVVRGDYTDPKEKGEVTHFQALATALSATVGLGNIAGVAVAVGIGGPGATFWMIVAGFLGMATKFTECTLGTKYRNYNKDGSVSGGPMYYMTKGFAERGVGGGKVLAVLFAVFCILGSLGGGNMFQVNQMHAQLSNVVGDYPGWITGIIFAVIVFAVIVGRLKGIVRVTEKIVPLMGIIYVAAAIIIIGLNIDKVGWAVGLIIDGAFTGEGVAGGAVGALIQGFRRAAFSNEAGVGSAAIAHSAARTDVPVTQGIVALLEPFVDTVVICTMTALVITITGQLIITPGEIATVGGNSGVELTSAAFSSAIAGFEYVLVIAVILFAFSTMLAWSYYGVKAWTFLFGEGAKKEMQFNIIFCICIIIGASASLGPVIDFSDASIFAMAVVNIAALYVLMPVVKKEINDYLAKLKSGEMKPLQ